MPPAAYTADVVCPMSAPPIPDGAVLVEDGRIVAVGPRRELQGDAARVTEVRGVLLPGLVNAHTHLEYTDAVHLAREGTFHRWLKALAGTARLWEPEQWTRSAHRGVLACLRAGVTAAFDVVSRGPAVPASGRAGLAGDSWVEAVMVDVRHHDAILGAIEGALDLPAEGRRLGIAPHSPYTLGTGVLQGLVALARRRDVPLHVHAAESRAEVLAIQEGKGPLTDGARAQGYEFEWLDGGTGLTPVRYLDECGALAPGTTLAHGVWVDGEEAARLAARDVAVVICARSNARLRCGEAPLERYAEAGTALAIGTDSAASSGDLDVLDEARAWVALARARGLSAWPDGRALEEKAVRLLTVEGARAMGWEEGCGVLEPGRRADLAGVGVATTPEHVYADLVESGPGRVVLTVVGGVRKARRDDAGLPWPRIDDSWRVA